MPSYSLCYFNGRGLGEIPRLLFAVAGVPYEDKRIEGKEWAQLKPDTLCHQLPQLTVDGTRLTESKAICRFLAREFGLYGTNGIEAAQIDAICSIAEDFLLKIFEVVLEKDEDKKLKARDQFRAETCGMYSGKMEDFLSAVNPKGDYFVGNKLSLADIVFFYIEHDCIHRACSCARMACLETHPELTNIYKSVLSNDGLQKWLKNRPDTEH